MSSGKANAAKELEGELEERRFPGCTIFTSQTPIGSEACRRRTESRSSQAEVAEVEGWSLRVFQPDSRSLEVEPACGKPPCFRTASELHIAVAFMLSY